MAIVDLRIAAVGLMTPSGRAHLSAAKAAAYLPPVKLMQYGAKTPLVRFSHLGMIALKAWFRVLVATSSAANATATL